MLDAGCRLRRSMTLHWPNAESNEDNDDKEMMQKWKKDSGDKDNVDDPLSAQVIQPKTVVHDS